MKTETKRDISRIPAHLRKYVRNRRYEDYTPVNHAVWRYVMRQNVHFHRKNAHPSYQEGLNRAGIVVDRIPRVEEMNDCLAPYGWGAVSIDGLIPGPAFFDFQAHGLLPIVADIRPLEHIAYTPAPDIIHEAAGHAPILCDEDYAEYVRIFGRIGAKALATREEHEAFLAARHLSRLMEDPNISPEAVRQARRQVEETSARCTEDSEATQISRLYWWTVEYGLIGSLEKPRIYGAGLLSSLHEGRLALSPDVKKLPFDLETCIRTPYDVTRPQPQLFVCRDFRELTDAVQTFSRRMAFRTGGTVGLLKAARSGDLATAVYDSGLAVSGTFSDVVLDEAGNAVYFRTSGPTALSVNGRELPGHDKRSHPTGFGSPVGLPQGMSRPLRTIEDLSMLGAAPGEIVECRLESGVSIRGRFIEPVSAGTRPVLLRLAEATVRWRDRILFTPDQGMFDWAIGDRIISVFAGAGDPESYHADEFFPDEPAPSDTPSWTSLDVLYQEVRDIRDGKRTLDRLDDIARELDRIAPDDWLLRLEMTELLVRSGRSRLLRERLVQQLGEIGRRHASLQALIKGGLKLAHLP